MLMIHEIILIFWNIIIAIIKRFLLPLFVDHINQVACIVCGIYTALYIAWVTGVMMTMI